VIQELKNQGLIKTIEHEGDRSDRSRDADEERDRHARPDIEQ
jgi:hypothetical protein